MTSRLITWLAIAGGLGGIFWAIVLWLTKAPPGPTEKKRAA
ncbi:hypothetical protein [Candidatus Nitrospira bockiana]